ncbi:hypothetical protein DICSQDRAFT_142019 [Dichomitus squalens LYAD-421 SS1]|uniref:uncharacterized protein n=1 Tax=Dichomitus squalens (strain LYAD-421) TaxID=732165 RepID=UPI0004414ED9|nr:uncharacterized protein DICSQDRAFT_142019 [Dichomitus squalens LYAD-421 SS1]EJF66419.1 hypothetical protein DICSQDRAFT_142019 [Dichomitus squalens LYAD-421 SS1]
MQLPHLLVVHGLKLFWDRVTFSRLTKIYFAFSVLHCIIQVIFQVQAFVANADAAKFLSGLIAQGNATDPGFAVYETDLRMCDAVPAKVLDSSSCTVIWDGHTSANGSQLISGSGTNYAANVTQSSPAAVSTITLDSSVSASPSTTAVLSVNATVLSSTVASTSSATLSTTALSQSSVLSSAASSSLATQSSASSSIQSALSSSPDAGTSSSTKALWASSTKAASSSSTKAASSSAAKVVSSAVATAAHAKTITLTVSESATATATATKTTASNDSDSDDDSDDESGDEDDNLFDRRDVVKPETQLRLTLNGTSTVNLHGLNGVFATELPRKCLYVLNWPVDVVDNTKREDITFIAFQIWLLGMSLVALLNESIPHIAASLLTHIMATAWGGFQIVNTNDFHKKFSTLTTKGACGVNLLPEYWKRRSNAEIPSLALNVFALLVSAFLSWRLMKTFGWQTFKRVGASRTINRVYNLVLMFSIGIQLALFFVGVSAALWVDQVYNGNIGRLTQDPTFFKAVMITVLVLLIPWLSVGWISVRREYRIRMLTFLAVAILVLAGWGTMFIAATFRWTYVTWFFFRVMTTGAVLLALAVLILGIVCRVNFGKGLTRYLNAHEELNDEGDYPTEKTYDSEKIDFPSGDSSVPSFSVTFGSGLEVPPPSQMRFGPAPRAMGPRFYSQTNSTASDPFNSPVEGNSLRALTLSRQNSASSQMSHSSTRSATSAHSTNSAGSTGPGRGKRWVIE